MTLTVEVDGKAVTYRFERDTKFVSDDDREMKDGPFDKRLKEGAKVEIAGDGKTATKVKVFFK